MTFKNLNLQENLLSAITDLGFETPSEVQEKAIPILLSKKTDLIALAQTGTGKTAAFGFPLIQHIDPNSRHTQGLILSPTRELCLQISKELELYAKYEKNLHIVAVYGGASISEQSRQLRRGAHIIVATPGRMQDMMRRNLADISQIDYCVLDEADEMLNMGFFQDITAILSHTPDEKNTWLFSATMPKEVSLIAKKFMSNPVEITVGIRNQGNINIQHEYYMVGGRDRYAALKRLADYNPGIFSIIFCRTKRDTQNVAEKLIEDGYNAAALHGDLSQSQRDMVMKSFRNNQIQLLVATDVAARGIDVDNITHVINYQLPDEMETYVHRSGRTGRAGNTGVSMVILTKSEARKVRQLEKITKKNFDAKALPDGMAICEKQLYHLVKGIQSTDINHEVDPYLPKIYELLENIDRDELIKKIVAVEFTRFANYYRNAKNIDVSASDHDYQKSESDRPRRKKNDEVRYFINIGSRDGLDWRRLKDFLRDQLRLAQDDVFKADVEENFSFFNTDQTHFDLVMSLSGTKYNGHTINIEKSKVGTGKKRFSSDGRQNKNKFGGRSNRFSNDKPSFNRKKR